MLHVLWNGAGSPCLKDDGGGTWGEKDGQSLWAPGTEAEEDDDDFDDRRDLEAVVAGGGSQEDARWAARLAALEGKKVTAAASALDAARESLKQLEMDIVGAESKRALEEAAAAVEARFHVALESGNRRLRHAVEAQRTAEAVLAGGDSAAAALAASAAKHAARGAAAAAAAEAAAAESAGGDNGDAAMDLSARNKAAAAAAVAVDAADAEVAAISAAATASASPFASASALPVSFVDGTLSSSRPDSSTLSPIPPPPTSLPEAVAAAKNAAGKVVKRCALAGVARKINK